MAVTAIFTQEKGEPNDPLRIMHTAQNQGKIEVREPMKTKSFCLLMLLIISLLLSSCDMGFGSKHIEDPQKYGSWESYLNIPSFFPSSIVDYQVNGYSYTLLAYMDICFEIFLDITVSPKQFEELIEEARSYAEEPCEKNAYYCDGYVELVFQDSYTVHRPEENIAENVGWADIEKIIYNPESLNIVYVCFHANDTGVYQLDKVAYFNRFSIQEKEYASNLR